MMIRIRKWWTKKVLNLKRCERIREFDLLLIWEEEKAFGKFRFLRIMNSGDAL